MPSTIDPTSVTHRLGEVPPVRVEVERHRLVVVEQLLRVRHEMNSTVAAWTRTQCWLTSTPTSGARSRPSPQLVAVIAGAGSGKTRVLTRRVAYRVATGTADLAHTVVLTFTREAAGELRRRLPRLGLTERVTAGTFHSVAQQLLRQRWIDLDQPPRTIVTDRRRIVGDDHGPAGSRRARRGARLGDGTRHRCRRRTRPPSATANAGRPVDAGSVAEALRRVPRREAQSRRGRSRRPALSSRSTASSPTPSSPRRCAGGSATSSSTRRRTSTRSSTVWSTCSGRGSTTCTWSATRPRRSTASTDPTRRSCRDVSERFPGDRGRAAAGQPPVHATDRADRRPGAARRTSSRADDRVGPPRRRDRGRSCATTTRPPRPRGSRPRSPGSTRHSCGALGSPCWPAPTRRSPRSAPHSPRPASRSGGRSTAPARHSTPLLTEAYRLQDNNRLRRWALDHVDARRATDDDPGREVAQAVLDYLREHPTGDGGGFRTWVTSNDPFGRDAPGVELLTFHAAKGREWHTVHLVGCETSLVPHRSATTNVGQGRGGATAVRGAHPSHRPSSRSTGRRTPTRLPAQADAVPRRVHERGRPAAPTTGIARRDVTIAQVVDARAPPRLACRRGSGRGHPARRRVHGSRAGADRRAAARHRPRNSTV